MLKTRSCTFAGRNVVSRMGMSVIARYVPDEMASGTRLQHGNYLERGDYTDRQFITAIFGVGLLTRSVVVSSVRSSMGWGSVVDFVLLK